MVFVFIDRTNSSKFAREKKKNRKEKKKGKKKKRCIEILENLAYEFRQKK
jgi:hypothetical protein